MEILTREQQIVLHLAGRSISAEPSSLVLANEYFENADWEEVERICQMQAITLSAFDALSPYKKLIPTAVYEHWKKNAFSALQSNYFVMQAQTELTALLQENSFPYIILKGLSAGAYYPKTDLRSLGDVDFLIEPEKQKEIENVLIENGYQKSAQETDHHVVFYKQKAHLEMHFEVAGIPHGEVGELVRACLQDALNSSIKRGENGVFYAPNDAHHGLILLLHMQHHMLGEGLGIRHLCDWATYVNGTYEKEYWAETLLPFLKKIGLYTYAKVMTKTCAIYLQSVCPDWACDAKEALCLEVISDVLACGNFGRNDEERSKGGMLVSEHGKEGTKHNRAYYLCKLLHTETMGNRAVNRCKLCYPFVYVWRICWHLTRAIFGKSKPIKVFNEAKKRKAIYDKLKVFERDTKEK
ncbi:MAG: hypothetical protein E7368_01200 [Clostridiales bacterium]|nr:hypothetical protein [Clostridiales bacterium]